MPSSSSYPLSLENITGVGACVACLGRITKCTTDRPRCEECRDRHTSCVYSAATLTSPRQSVAAKRTHDQLQAQFSAYEKVYSLLRTKPDNVATDIVRRIRRGADVQAILRHIQDGDLLLQLSIMSHSLHQAEELFPAEWRPPERQLNNVYLDSVLYKTTLGSAPSIWQLPGAHENTPSHRESVYHTPYHKAQIVDARLNSATLKVSNWTSISTDERFLRKLLETYFLFEYPFYPFLHKDFFLDDMMAGRHDFCSPLLVNTILAAACHGLSAIKNRSEFWNPRNYGYQFLAEAKRLWELEEVKTEHAVTTVQAASIMGITYFVNGMDKIGWSFWTQAVAMGETLGLFSVPGTSLSQRETVVRTITAWGIFGQQATSCFYFVKPPLLNGPPKAVLPDRQTAPSFFGEIWIKYPEMQTLYPLHISHTFLALAELRMLMNDIGSEALATHRAHAEISFSGASKFHAQLGTWHQNLPSALGAERAVLPHHLMMHMQYHNLLTQTLTPLIRLETAFNPHDGSTSLTDYLDFSPSATVAHATACLETLLHMFYARHGFEDYYIFLLQILVQVGFQAADKLQPTSSSTKPNHHPKNHVKPETRDGETNMDSNDENKTRQTLLLCAKGIRDQGRNFYLAELVFRVLRSRMADRDIASLNAVTGDAEKDVARDGDGEWRERVHGEWPVNVVGITQDVDGLRIEELVREVRDMGISSSSGVVTDGVDGVDGVKEEEEKMDMEMEVDGV